MLPPTGASRSGRSGNVTRRLLSWPRFPQGWTRGRRRWRYFSRVAADKSDEQGVLGNLPRSRPGRRSARRGSGSETASVTAGEQATSSAPAKAAPSTRAKAARAKAKASRSGAKTAPRSGAKASKPRSTTKASSPRAAAKPRPAPRSEPSAPPRAPEHDPRGGTDPLTGAVRLAGKVAEVGLKTAGGLLKRLPGR
jgi:hypothetical protein